MQGALNNIGFRFARPAVLRQAGSDWIMQPVTVNLQQQGRVRLAGRWGSGLTIQARLDELNLTVLNAFSPGLGIGGRATGSLDFYHEGGGAFPRAEGPAQRHRLHPDGHRRAFLAGRSVHRRRADAGRRAGGRDHPAGRCRHRPGAGAAAAARAGRRDLADPLARGAARGRGAL